MPGAAKDPGPDEAGPDKAGPDEAGADEAGAALAAGAAAASPPSTAATAAMPVMTCDLKSAPRYVDLETALRPYVAYNRRNVIFL
jgi:hypothetical protein